MQRLTKIHGTQSHCLTVSAQSCHFILSSTIPLGKEGIPNWGISKVPLLLAGERENLKESGFVDDSQ